MNTRHTFDHVFSLEVAIAAAVFAVVTGTVLFAVVWSRIHRGKDASQKSSHPRAEILYALVITGAAVFLVVLSLSANTAPATPRPSLRVHVTGFQWCWQFSYEGTPVSVTGDCVHGAAPTLVLPANEPVQMDVTTNDVIHALWVPYLRFKMDAVPDHVNTFTWTVPPAGNFAGRCAEYCGLYHPFMEFTLQAMPRARFEAWLRAREVSPA
ncbi:MAG TPA: cytochrome c oxidase subunit II [Acidimicrobiales bacterium]|nr:cytochrome c oxidase subunit II [Acidimicrobiales bacterium]